MLKFYGLVSATDQGLDVEEFIQRHDAEERMVERFCETIQDLFVDVGDVVAELREKVRNADRSKESLLEGIGISDNYFGINKFAAWCDSQGGASFDWEVKELVVPES